MIYILLCKGSIVDRVMMPTWFQLASQKSTKIQEQSRPRALPILASFFDRFRLLYTLGSIMTIWKYVSVSYGFAWPWGVGYSLGPGEPWITRARNLGLPWGSERTTNHDLAWYFENTASMTSFPNPSWRLASTRSRSILPLRRVLQLAPPNLPSVRPFKKIAFFLDP